MPPTSARTVPHPASPLRFAILFVSLLVSRAAILAGDEFDAVRQHIRESLAHESLPSLAVAVARDGQIVWEEGFGWANREQRIAATPHTMYSIASISKPITATGIMVLVEREQLNLDRPVNDYLATAKVSTTVGQIDGVSIRRLANHSSGLPLHYQFFYADEGHRLPPFEESVRRYGRLVAAPGAQYEYSNFGYGILGHLLERHGGGPVPGYGDFLRREVFVPLGMSHTAEGVPPELVRFRAERYGPDQRPIPHYDFDHPGASAIYSSAHDLARFGLFHLKRKLPDQKAILQDAMLDAMQQPAVEASNGIHYGIGWFVTANEHGYRTVGHSGGMGGVRTRLVLVPDQGVAVAVLCNTSSDAPMRVAKKILGTLLPEYGRKYEESLNAPRERGRSRRTKGYGPPELVGVWEGQIHTYAGPRRFSLSCKPDGDVHARIDEQLVALVNNSRLANGLLTGVFTGDIGTDDANRRPYHLHLKLRLGDNVMQGAVTAMSLPGVRAGNALSHYAELRRVVDAEGVRTLLTGNDLGGWKIAEKYDFSRHGAVKLKDGELTLEQGQPATGVSWQGPLPREDYELSLEAKRVAGHDFFCGLTFPVADEYCTLIIGGWGGGVTGLSNINGMSAVENETTDSRDFKLDHWYRIRLRVEAKRIEAWIDDDQIVNVDRTDKKFSVWWEQEPMRPLGIASWNTHAVIRNVKLKEIDGAP